MLLPSLRFYISFGRCVKLDEFNTFKLLQLHLVRVMSNNTVATYNSKRKSRKDDPIQYSRLILSDTNVDYCQSIKLNVDHFNFGEIEQPSIVSQIDFYSKAQYSIMCTQ